MPTTTTHVPPINQPAVPTTVAAGPTTHSTKSKPAPIEDSYNDEDFEVNDASNDSIPQPLTTINVVPPPNNDVDEFADVEEFE